VNTLELARQLTLAYSGILREFRVSKFYKRDIKSLYLLCYYFSCHPTVQEGTYDDISFYSSVIKRWCHHALLIDCIVVMRLSIMKQ